MLEVLQTIGICVGAVALVVIAYSAFIVSTAIVMATEPFEEDDLSDDEINAAVIREINRKLR